MTCDTSRGGGGDRDSDPGGADTRDEFTPVLYATDVGAVSEYRPGLLLRRAGWIHLISERGAVVDRTSFVVGGKFEVGETIRFPCHVAWLMARRSMSPFDHARPRCGVAVSGVDGKKHL